jgi:microcystin-dependent protein
VLLGNGTSALQAVAPSTSGNVLTSDGTTWTSAQGFVTGMIMLWSGSIASIPSGWALCDGGSGTPDLQDRFVVGAGSSYAVDDTGGFANATLVSHTHTASSSTSISDPQHQHNQNTRSANFLGYSNYGIFPGGDLQGGIEMNVEGGRNTSLASTGISASTSTSISTEGVSATDANLPPYFALAYIMKL